MAPPQPCPLAAFGAGALVFLASQVILRLPWQIPLGRWVQAHPDWLIPFLLFSSLTAGLFEQTGRWAGYRYLLPKERTLRGGVMFGLGHGALEAILLAGLPLAGLLVTWVMASRGLLHSEATIEAVRQQTAALDAWKVLLAAHLSPLIGELVLVVMAFGVLVLGWQLARQAEESGAPVW